MSQIEGVEYNAHNFIWVLNYHHFYSIILQHKNYAASFALIIRYQTLDRIIGIIIIILIMMVIKQ